MVLFAGQGDPRRSMSLLWRTEAPATKRSAPGPKPALSVDAIVDAGIALADAEGMAALSMRAVGERLGRTAMALYTYVPGKGELLDLMYDRALAELPTDYDLTPGWRAAVTSWAEDTWEFYLRHPWVLQVSQARPVLGPNEYCALEALLRLLYATELSSAMLRRIVGTLVHFVRGAAQTVVESRLAAASTGVSDDEWWRARSTMLGEVVPDFSDRFPLLVRLETEGASHHTGAALHDDDAAPCDDSGPDDDAVPYMEREAKTTFEVGLTVILDGIEATIHKTGKADEGDKAAKAD